ncbi:MAG: primosomal protein N' [Candidatus Sumerlaeia bacterium]|nr:primosomal protein N' [Candidatus Sumerlaeia bacterium]
MAVSDTQSCSWEFADVALDLPLEGTFQYRIPEPLRGQIPRGALVRVPFRNLTEIGCVVGFGDKPNTDKPIKFIAQRVVPDFRVDGDLLDLARWMAEYYFCPLGQTLACVSAIGLCDVSKRRERLVALTDFAAHYARWKRGEWPPPKTTPQQQLVLAHFLETENAPVLPAALAELIGVGDGVIRNLVEKGTLRVIEIERYRPDFYPAAAEPDRPHPLNPAQAAALEQILGAIAANQFRAFLLHGVTGSGKTEVYLQAIARVMEMGRQAIVLVPEIALTPQTVERFRRRFGGAVGVYHSRLSLGQKYDLWRRIKSGEVKIVIGARSAVFTPFDQCGLIVIDEEHETSYKQGESPRYHARDVALMRARARGFPVVLGSATPSLESYYNARQGKFVLLELPERIDSAPLPEVTLIDMADEVRATPGGPAAGILSRNLQQAIRERLTAKEQVILFLNRRGFSQYAVCLQCRHMIHCVHCDVLLTYHKWNERLCCHYCGAEQKIPPHCPKCGEGEMSLVGIGTEKVEEMLGRLYPEARLLRVDLDTIGTRTAFIDAWQQISTGQVDIILGTQMIAKGFHLERVTLVGVIAADIGLVIPDFRSAERTFSLLTQVAGRAGRGERPGEVLVQTYMPQHYAVRLAQSHDYKAFYSKEIEYRRILAFPPFTRAVALIVSAKEEQRAKEQAGNLGAHIRRAIRAHADRDPAMRLLGPAPSPIAKIKDQFRWRLFFRGHTPSVMRRVLAEGIASYEKAYPKPRLQLVVDVDPQDML